MYKEKYECDPDELIELIDRYSHMSNKSAELNKAMLLDNVPLDHTQFA